MLNDNEFRSGNDENEERAPLASEQVQKTVRETVGQAQNAAEQVRETVEQVQNTVEQTQQPLDQQAQAQPQPQPQSQPQSQSQSQQTPPSVGIRYDADRRAADGAYTWNYSEPRPAKRAEKPKKGFLVFVCAAMAFIIVGTAVLSSFLTSAYLGNAFAGAAGNENAADTEAERIRPTIGQQPPEKGIDANETVNMVLPERGKELTKQEIAVKCKPSSVGIQVSSTGRSFYGYTYKSSGVGSGFILTEDGYIATNCHVVETADTITVRLDDGTTYDATLVGSDSITDLAVIKIEAEGLVPMEIGDSDQCTVGDSVIAIGTPAGIELAGTVTDGIISAVNRDFKITNDYGKVTRTLTLLQTNAAINPGNSGGPLINSRGQVIGINTLKLNSAYENIAFSIPINSAVKIFNQLIDNGKVTEYDSSFVTGNGMIGITQYAEISEQEAEYYNIPEGIIIIQIDKESSAVAAGLRRGDIIIAYNGEKATTIAVLNELKAKNKAGDEVTLRVYRDGEGEKDIVFKLDLMKD